MLFRDSVDVLVLSTYDTDGAGKFSLLLASIVEELGYSVRLICLENRSGSPASTGLIDGSLIKKVFQRINSRLARLVVRTVPRYAFLHLGEWRWNYFKEAENLPLDCRLLILTYTSGMIDTKTLGGLRNKYKECPIWLYAVDMNFITGGCHYSDDCNKYLCSCDLCPAVPRLFHGYVRNTFASKKDFYSTGGFRFVASSTQLAQQASLSPLVAGRMPIEKLLMAVDESIFGSFEDQRMILRNELKVGKKTLMLRSSSEERKGCAIFIDALLTLVKCNPHYVDDLTIICVGDSYIYDSIGHLCIDIRNQGYVHNLHELSRLYSIADVFLVTSISDSGPVMMAQAVMSGTPLISTDVGMARDLIIEESTGFIIPESTSLCWQKALKLFLDEEYQFTALGRQKNRSMALKRMGKSVYRKNLSALLVNSMDQ